MLGPVLETPRLILRPQEAADFEPYAAFMADEASRFVGGPQERSVAWRGFCTIAGAWVAEGFSMFSVVEKQSGAWVGRVGPWRPSGWPGDEVGWGIVPAAQRRGYALEAAQAALDWAFDGLGWPEAIHCIDPLNAPSIAVAQRLGSTLLRRTVPAPAPIIGVVWDIYGQSREAWRARRKGG